MMGKRIVAEFEKYEDDNDGFRAVALTGDTFGAKDIIKAAGFKFSDQVGYGKAWRSPVFRDSDIRENTAHGQEVKRIANKVRDDLMAAGYEYIVVR